MERAAKNCTHMYPGVAKMVRFGSLPPPRQAITDERFYRHQSDSVCKPLEEI